MAGTNRDRKRTERSHRFASLSAAYHAPFDAFDKAIINKPIDELVREVQTQSLSALDVLRTYGKVAVNAHEKTNCVTELLLPEAETWAQTEVNLKGALAGVPVSLKDSVQVRGFDITLGYTRLAGKPYADDGPMVKLLKDAGSWVSCSLCCKRKKKLFLPVFDSKGIWLQGRSRTRKLPCLLRFCPLNLPMGYGVIAETPICRTTLRAALPAERALCLPLAVVSGLARMLLAPFACLQLGAASTRCAAARGAGQRSASIRVCLARKESQVCSARWLALCMI